jgi:signal transduction histidine kinase
VLLAIAPFIILSLLNDIINLTDKEMFGPWRNLIQVALGFSFVWMIAMWFITNKQRKALDKEKIKTKKEAEQKTIMAAMKDELEVQVAQRTSELTRQKEELLQTLEELKSAQSQLIQSEKMASLGELTSGIAHEIQNPLNFVNNFSDVNTELLLEMKDEIEKGNKDEAKAIADNVIDNEQKINHHGKRADAIVKGMLQHSRKSSGLKEPTDINVLADEYLRLSYHGLRAKDKTFNATMKTDFDESIEKINVIPQDIGRVLLNLFNNAFYAVSEKKKHQPENYEPTVFVSTKRLGGNVEICVKDNGSGIPRNIIDKIFQPFFTTKPTGEGTGLGLSLSYDIIKAHGGTLKVETVSAELEKDGKDGGGTEFIITLPV